MNVDARTGNDNRIPLSVTKRILAGSGDGFTGRTPDDGEIVRVQVDQTILQDRSGLFPLHALTRSGTTRTPVFACQYIEDDLRRGTPRDAADHLFLQSASDHLGVHFSPAGNGLAQVIHLREFAIPGAVIVGPGRAMHCQGALGCLALRVSELEAARALAGHGLDLREPPVLGLRMRGHLQPRVGARDVGLELVRRFGRDGLRGLAVECFGDGLEGFGVAERFVLADASEMLGASSFVFPSDEVTRRWLEGAGRGGRWTRLESDGPEAYDEIVELDLDAIEPLAWRGTAENGSGASPTDAPPVVLVRDLEGLPVRRVGLGCHAMPSFDTWQECALPLLVHGIARQTALDFHPPTRLVMLQLADSGLMGRLEQTGASWRTGQDRRGGLATPGLDAQRAECRVREAPQPVALSTWLPGTPHMLEADDGLLLCSVETAIASGITGRVRDPRELPDIPENGGSTDGTAEVPEPTISPGNLVIPPSSRPTGPILVEEEEVPFPELARFPQATTFDLVDFARLSALSPEGEAMAAWSQYRQVRAGIKRILRDDLPSAGWIEAPATFDPSTCAGILLAARDRGMHVLILGPDELSGEARRILVAHGFALARQDAGPGRPPDGEVLLPSLHAQILDIVRTGVAPTPAPRVPCWKNGERLGSLCLDVAPHEARSVLRGSALKPGRS